MKKISIIILVCILIFIIILNWNSIIDTFILIFIDDKNDLNTAVSAFDKLIDFKKVSLVVGPSCRSLQSSIIPIIKEKNITEYVTEFPAIGPLVELSYVRIVAVLLEGLALCLGYIKFKKF